MSEFLESDEASQILSKERPGPTTSVEIMQPASPSASASGEDQRAALVEFSSSMRALSPVPSQAIEGIARPADTGAPLDEQAAVARATSASSSASITEAPKVLLTLFLLACYDLVFLRTFLAHLLHM